MMQSCGVQAGTNNTVAISNRGALDCRSSHFDDTEIHHRDSWLNEFAEHQSGHQYSTTAPKNTLFATPPIFFEAVNTPTLEDAADQFYDSVFKPTDWDWDHYTSEDVLKHAAASRLDAAMKRLLLLLTHFSNNNKSDS